MSMNMGWTDVTLSGGAGTASWQHPFQISDGANAEVVELDAAPDFYWYTRTSAPGGLAGVISMTVTATGVTLASTHPGDTGVIRCYGIVRALPQWWQA